MTQTETEDRRPADLQQVAPADSIATLLAVS
jgi:hypothetical protein